MMARAMSDAAPCFSLCGFLVELSPHHGTQQAYTLPKWNQGLLASGQGHALGLTAVYGLLLW